VYTFILLFIGSPSLVSFLSQYLVVRVTNRIAARNAQISDRNDNGSLPDGCPKYVSNIVPSSSAKTNPIDPLNGIAPPSVAMCTFSVDYSSS
jgi:hypothetical protein